MSIYCPHCTMITYNEKRCDCCQQVIKKEKIKKRGFFGNFIDMIDNLIDEKVTKPQKNKITKPKVTISKQEMITITQIAKQLNTNSTIVTSTLMEIGFIEKSGNWSIVTDLGETQGGIQRYNAKTKQKYTTWEDDIVDNELLIEAINKSKREPKYKTKIEKGKDYEEYVAKVYRSRGYHVSEHGKLRGREDHGIDLIAKKEKEIILIQCKDWKEDGRWRITHEKIKSFQTDARTFVEDKPLLRKSYLKARYTISGDFMDKSAIRHIEEMQKKGKRIDFEIIKIEE